MVSFLKACALTVLTFFGYLGLHYLCAFTLPLSPNAYTVCANLATVAAFAALCLWCKRSPFEAAGARPMRRMQWIAVLGAGIGVCLVVRWMMSVIPFPQAWSQAYSDRVEVIEQSSAPWVRYLSSVVVAPFVEELVFRGVIYRGLKKGVPMILAALVSAALFAVLHGTIMWICYTFFFGLFLCVLYEKTQSLWACILCHTVFNIVGQISFYGLPVPLILLIYAAGMTMLIFSMKDLEREKQRMQSPAEISDISEDLLK